VWGRQAEVAQRYLKKGALVCVEGRIRSREWRDKVGTQRTAYEIIACGFRMLGGRAVEGKPGESDRTDGPAARDPELTSAAMSERTKAQSSPDFAYTATDDDIPF
jgi:single-strand DNA-binding protein